MCSWQELQSAAGVKVEGPKLSTDFGTHQVAKDEWIFKVTVQEL